MSGRESESSIVIIQSRKHAAIGKYRCSGHLARANIFFHGQDARATLCLTFTSSDPNGIQRGAVPRGLALDLDGSEDVQSQVGLVEVGDGGRLRREDVADDLGPGVDLMLAARQGQQFAMGLRPRLDDQEFPE